MRAVNVVLVHVAVVAIEIRVLCVAVGLVRTLLQRRRLVASRFGPIEALLVPESLLLGGLAYAAHLTAMAARPTTSRAVEAAIGATLTVLCLALLLWTVASWRGLFTGHAVVDGQKLVTAGAFGFVRHPVYLGVILSWLGGALAFESWIMAAMCVLYVIPGYVLYARSEERMMMAVFGGDYDAYRLTTPMLIPSIDKLAPLTKPV
jgi:protein-S-isoprenylcysteine O-methyltransferase Ste14